MWQRSELKAKGRGAFLANYWRCVLVAFILGLLTASSSGGSASSTGQNLDENQLISENQTYQQMKAQIEEFIGQLKEQIGLGGLLAIFGAIVAFLAAIAVVSMLLKLFIFNPVIVGCCGFFVQNSESRASLNEMGRGFKPRWGNVALTMFLQDLFLTLWFMLLIIPGFIKIYSYRMVPYILADQPELSATEVITRSRQMMNGNKWKSFVFDLSFIGWYLLTLVTFGLAGIFYVGPYKEAADAELYKAIKGEFRG